MTQQSHSWAYSGKDGSSNLKRYMRPNVHCSTVYSSQDMEVTEVSIGNTDSYLIKACSPLDTLGDAGLKYHNKL